MSNTDLYPYSYLMGEKLNGASDVEFAEIFASYYKIHFKQKRDGTIVQEDMDFNIHELTTHIEKSLNEIIYSETMDASAWWKDDKFFGRNTPKEKFLAQTPEFQQRHLMETAMTVQNIYKHLVETKEIEPLNDDLYDLFCELAQEFEYTFFDTDEYENDWVSVLEEWVPKEIKERYGL